MPALAIAWRFLTGLPWWAYLAIALFGAHFYLVHQAVSDNNVEWEGKLLAEREAYAVAVKDLQGRQREVVTRTVVEYRDRVKIVKEKGDEIVREIQVLAPMDSPTIAGWVRVIHDSATTGHLPDDPSGAAAAAEPVEAVALLTTVAENYTTCRADNERLVALQKLLQELPKS